MALCQNQQIQISNLLSFCSFQSNTKVRWHQIKDDINPAERFKMLDSRTARAGSCSAVWWWSIFCCSSTSVRGRSWKKLFRDCEESLTIFPVPAAAQDYVLDREQRLLWPFLLILLPSSGPFHPWRCSWGTKMLWVRVLSNARISKICFSQLLSRIFRWTICSCAGVSLSSVCLCHIFCLLSAGFGDVRS